jgi:lysophospholipase L1-like esterase
MKSNPAGPKASMSWKRRALWVAGTLLLSLLAAEFGLRAVGALVMRRQTAVAESSADGRRIFTILCVGDSWTQGAPYGRYPDFLAERLERAHPDLQIRTVNLGSAGTNSSQAVLSMAEMLAKRHPDLIVAMTGNNDHHNLTASNYWKFQDRELGSWDIAMAGLRTQLHASRVFRLTRAVWQGGSGGATSNEFFEAGQTEHHRGLISIDPETHRKQLEYNLTKIVELARANEIPLVFQTYFHFHGYHVNEVIRDVASRYGLPLADHNYVFHTAIPAAEREGLRIADGHPNREGYELIARTLAETLEEAGLVPGN